jgi:predicted nucleic acid-binding protein
MMILPDSSVLIPYFTRQHYAERIERALRAGRLALCSVVAEEVLAGARSQQERRLYDRFFGQCQRLGLVITPDYDAWRMCGRLLSRYRERFGALEPRDHQNDVLIVLTARQLARQEATTVVTENDRHFITWQRLAGDTTGLHIEAARR